MPIIVFELQELVISQEQAERLLETGVIRDANQGDDFDPGPGIYYPNAGYTLAGIKRLFTELSGF